MNRVYLRLSRDESITNGNGWERQEYICSMVNADVIYRDVISGAKRKRPELDRMLNDLRKGDIVYIASIDRLSRSVRDLIEIADIIKEKGAYLVSIKDTWLDTRESNPLSDFLLTIMGAMYQLERDMITKRIQEGVKAAQSRGVKFGRPRGWNKEVQHAVRMYNKGEKSLREVERITGVSKSTISKAYRVMKERGEI